MRKLTAERAQERIAHLKQWQEQRGLTLREEEYLEAMEIAARVLSMPPVKPEHPAVQPYGDPYSVWVDGANWMLEQIK